MMRNATTGALLRVVQAATGLLVVLSAPVAAQSDSGKPKRDLIVTIGAGAQVLPRYPGADEIQVTPLPIFGLRRDGDPLSFGAADQGSGIDILPSKKIDFGPVVQLQSSRRNKDVGAAVGKVPFTVEGGAFVQAFVMPYLRLRLEGRRGIGGHDAWVGDVSADFVARDGDRTIFSLGPRVRIADAKYQRTYFGVTPAAAAATGLPVYRPGGGIYEVGVATSLTHQFNFTWGMRAFAGYDRLVRDASDSPLVRRYGERNQFSAGLGLSYTFRVHRGGN
jgi:outer membrane scaffolding protein for murein synthesis (MipA/OmpV family)